MTLQIVIPRLMVLGFVVQMILGPVVSWPIPLLSHKSNHLAVIDELLDQKPQGYAPFCVMTCLFMEITIFTFILPRRVTWYLWWSAKLWVSFNLHKDLWYPSVEGCKIIVLELLSRPPFFYINFFKLFSFLFFLGTFSQDLLELVITFKVSSWLINSSILSLRTC